MRLYLQWLVGSFEGARGGEMAATNIGKIRVVI